MYVLSSVFICICPSPFLYWKCGKCKKYQLHYWRISLMVLVSKDSNPWPPSLVGTVCDMHVCTYRLTHIPYIIKELRALYHTRKLAPNSINHWFTHMQLHVHAFIHLYVFCVYVTTVLPCLFVYISDIDDDMFLSIFPFRSLQKPLLMAHFLQETGISNPSSPCQSPRRMKLIKSMFYL